MQKIFTVPPGRSFLDCLAAAVLSGNLPEPGGAPPDPLDLPSYTIMLPTRRASRALQDAFLRASGGKTMLLPRIVPIAEGDEDATLLANLAMPGGSDARLADIPLAIDPLERRLVLARLVIQWSAAARRATGESGDSEIVAGARTTAEAVSLAAELARLIDMVETEGADLNALQGLVPDEMSRHWQDTLDFLKIVTEWWPAHLAEADVLSPADRRNQVLRAEARRIREHPTGAPVIVAGVTGSIPATADVMRAVAMLDRGAVVLPALDLHLDDESWARILPSDLDRVGHPEHPQFGFAKLLGRLGVTRADVRPVPGSSPSAATQSRARVMSEALRPSATTDLWRNFLSTTDADAIRKAMAGISLVEAATAAEEAEVVALVLRKALETPGATAALVSPDRRLARRVAVRLKAYGISIDDSAGKPFAKTPPGTFLELVVDVVRRDFEPAAVVSLLGHPLLRLGRPSRDIRFAARALEIAAFRGLYLGRGLAGMARALERAEMDKDTRGPATRRLWTEDWQRAHALVADLRTAFEPLTGQFVRNQPISLRDLAAAHALVAGRLAELPPEEAAETAGNPLWQGEDGELASSLFARLADVSLGVPDLAPTDYPDVFRALFGTENVRLRGPVHPRLSIWGPFESRLQQPDVVVIGSLNDGTWPEAADPGPWLNRPMRQSLGLPSPEEKIGFAAHDMWSLLGTPEVVMTRALKVDSTPTVASRWLLRLQALLEGAGAKDALKPTEPWLGWVRARDRVPPRKPYAAPEPRPPLALRPRRLSVSAVETWIANPYALYAKRILGLEALKELGAPPDEALRGSVLHEILRQFTRAHPDSLPEDIAGTLMRHADELLRAYTDDPRVAGFWLPRFERFAEWFAETEPLRRADVRHIATETEGELALDVAGRPFQINARADRIDTTPSGYVITDYKSGQLPVDKAVTEAVAPQLPLEAAIALAGGFDGIPASGVAALRFIRATGGEPPGEQRDVVAGTEKVAGIVEQACADLKKLVEAFDDEATPYRALRRAKFKYDYDDYAHLARVDEWSSADGEAE